MGRSRRQRMSTLFGGNLASGWMRAALLLSLASLSKAQVGTNICSCSPPTYEFTLDFSLSCDDSQLDGQGISDFECVIAPFQTGANIDLTPASVETIDFVEFDQALGRLAESSLFQQFLDGQSFTYTATTADPGSVMMPTVPRALQVTMLAQNSIGQPLLMTWLITFSNSCNDFPVINVGNRVGWTTFTALTEPDVSICAAVDPPTPATVAPTAAPVVATPYPTRTAFPTVTAYPTAVLPPPFPCRPIGSPSKGKGKGQSTNVFSGEYYYDSGKGKKSKKKKGGKSGSKSKKSGKSGKKSKKGGKMDRYSYYTKGKGVVAPEDDDDLPICPPARPVAKGRPQPPRPNRNKSPKNTPPNYRPVDDDQMVFTRAPSAPSVQQAADRPTTAQGSEPPAGAPTGLLPDFEDADTRVFTKRGMRASLLAGAGVAASLMAVIATYIYKRERQYSEKEMHLQQHQEGATSRRPRIASRQGLSVADTMSYTEATESETAALNTSTDVPHV